MYTPLATTRVIAAAMLAVLLAAAGRAWCADQDGAPNARVYEDGPLTAADYRGEAPSGDRILDAFTTTELQYRFQCQTYGSARRVTAWTTQIEVEAVVIAQQSWNTALQNSRLMDHEQGHFDITQAGALRARLHFARHPRLSSVAANSELAIANLRDQLQRQMEKFAEAVLAEHQAYDRATRHGLDRTAQQEHRRQHREQIQALSRELEDLQRTDLPHVNPRAVAR